VLLYVSYLQHGCLVDHKPMSRGSFPQDLVVPTVGGRSFVGKHWQQEIGQRRGTAEEKAPDESAALQAFLDILPTPIPIEDHAKMKPYTVVNDMVKRIKEQSTRLTLDALAAEVDHQKMMVQQLIACMQPAARSLDRLVAKRKAEVSRKVTEATKQAAEESRRKLADEDRKAVARLKHARNTRPFSAPWHGADSILFIEVRGLSGLRELDAGSRYDKPVLVNEVELNGSKLNQTWVDWTKSFEAFCAAQSKPRTSSELTASRGLDELGSLWEAALPTGSQLEVGMPSVKAACESVYLFGALPGFPHSGFDSMFLGSVRYLHIGMMGLLLVSAVDLEKGLATQQPQPKLTVPALQDWFGTVMPEDLNPTKIEAIKAAGITVHCITMKPKSCLIVPPGYCVASVGTLDGETCYGLRRAFIAPGPLTEANFKVLERACKDNGDARVYLNSVIETCGGTGGAGQPGQGSSA